MKFVKEVVVYFLEVEIIEMYYEDKKDVLFGMVLVIVKLISEN